MASAVLGPRSVAVSPYTLDEDRVLCSLENKQGRPKWMSKGRFLQEYLVGHNVNTHVCLYLGFKLLLKSEVREKLERQIGH